jgi:2-polyprenyl-6-methoxyphenol hydroxylase-like FAD-dependent oxidoreductase
MHRDEVPVLIVGGGPIGLSMAVLLGRFGIPAILLEKDAATTDHPKARGCFARTMEIFRVWGIENPIRVAGLPDGADHFAIGRTLADLRSMRPEPDPGQGPAWKSIVAQDAVERELLNAARRFGSTDIRFMTECIGFTQDAEGVTAQVSDLNTGGSSEIRCRYLVACDGAGSQMRKIAGIKMTGIPSLGYWVNDYFQVDLSDFATARKAAALLFAPLEAGDQWISVLNTDGTDRWLALRRVGADRDERANVPTDDELILDFKRRLGIDRKVEVINRSNWRAAREVAERYCDGRVFLVGDAAHRFIPTGGQGMNTGIADAHNLAWKLAFSLTGAMDSRVLDTYDIERRPVGNHTADFQVRTGNRARAVQARINLADEDSFSFWTNELEKHVLSVGQTLGQWYPEGALIADETTPPTLDPQRYTPVDRPGHRFPHLWLDPGKKESTIDWFDKAFVLVIGPLAQGWRSAGAVATGEILTPLVVRTLEAPDREHGIMIGKRGATLVRPDGYVAWRSPSSSDTALEDLRKVLGLLGVTFRSAGQPST